MVDVICTDYLKAGMFGRYTKHADANLQAWLNELGLMSVRGPEAWTRECPTLPALLKDIVKVLVVI